MGEVDKAPTADGAAGPGEGNPPDRPPPTRVAALMPVPSSGGGEYAQARLLARAVRCFPMDDALYARVVKEAGRIMKRGLTEKARLAAARTLVLCAEHNRKVARDEASGEQASRRSQVEELKALLADPQARALLSQLEQAKDRLSEGTEQAPSPPPDPGAC